MLRSPFAVITIIVVLAVLGATAPGAAAQPSAPPSSVPVSDSPDGGETETVHRWYGYQVLAADTTTWALVIKADVSGYPLFFSGSMVHLLNGELGRAVGSIALRFGGTLLGAVAGSAAFDGDCDSSENWCLPLGGVFGGFVGLVTAQLIDAFGVSYKEVERPSRWIAPTARVTEGGGTVGLAGTF